MELEGPPTGISQPKTPLVRSRPFRRFGNPPVREEYIRPNIAPFSLQPFFSFSSRSHSMASNTSQNQSVSVLEDGIVRPGIYMIVNTQSNTFVDILDTKELCCRPEYAIPGKGRVRRIPHPSHVLMVDHQSSLVGNSPSPRRALFHPQGTVPNSHTASAIVGLLTTTDRRSQKAAGPKSSAPWSMVSKASSGLVPPRGLGD